MAKWFSEILASRMSENKRGSLELKGVDLLERWRPEYQRTGQRQRTQMDSLMGGGRKGRKSNPNGGT